MLKKYLTIGLILIFSLIMLAGSDTLRIAKASFFGRTLFFPFVQSIKAVEYNRQLQRENFELKSKLTESTLSNIALKNALKELSEEATILFNPDISEFELAEVIGYSGQFQERNLIVDKGERHRIKRDSAVISGNGIVGKVVSVSDSYSIILPFSNPHSQLPVMDSRTGVQGILQADISGSLYMNLIKLGSEVASGDTIVTSNLSRLFPKGYPVGTVKRIRESVDNLFVSAEIAPFTIVENLEHVFILNKRSVNE